MAMRQWEPLESVLPLRDAMDRLLAENFAGPLWPSALSFARVMPLDVYETEKEYEVEIALPGTRPDDVEITAQGRTITIDVTRKPTTHNEKTGKYVRREHYTGELTRTIELPEFIDAEHITATFEHGMLYLRVPKAEHVKKHKIPIQAQGTKPAIKSGREEALAH